MRPLFLALRVVAWLATGSTAQWPDGSEPFATAGVTLDSCGGSDGYCGIAANVDLVPATAATARPR